MTPVGRAKVRLLDHVLGRGGVVSVTSELKSLNDGPGVSSGTQAGGAMAPYRELLTLASLPPYRTPSASNWMLQYVRI